MNRINQMNIKIKEIEIPKKTICLNMIVKDESKIIEDTLNNLLKYFNFSYWLICDTGSEDNTKDIIRDYFKNKDIPGELLEHKWRDFAYNRTLALEAALDKTDYVLIADADDRIYGNLKLPTELKCDKYNLKFGQDFTYYRPILINNRLKSGWCFKGVVHEFLSNKDPTQTIKEETIKGDYYFGIGTFGARSNDPDKYLKDAIILSEAFETDTNTGMRERYAFYCAQSFMDAKKPEKAIEWYLKVLKLNNWNQEKYYACLKLGQLYQGLGENDKAINIWSQSYKYDSERLDCIASLMCYYYNKGNHLLVNSLYNKYKSKIKDNNNHQDESKLFLDIEAVYKFEYYNSISAFYIGDLQCGYESCKKLIINKKYLDICVKNMKFYDNQLKKDEDNIEFFSIIEDIRNKIVKKEINTANISFVDIEEIWNMIFQSLHEK